MPQAGDPGVSHGMAEIRPGLRLHYVEAGAGPRTVVLPHGSPWSLEAVLRLPNPCGVARAHVRRRKS